MLSAVQPGSPAHRHVLERVAAGEPVVTVAPALLEVSFGFERAGPRGANSLRLLARLVQDDVVAVVPVTATAALLAGRLRARAPLPPGARPRGDRRPKAERRAAWVLDILIAAAAHAGGYGIATSNRDDFEALAVEIARLIPGGPPLEVGGPPFGTGA